MVNTRLASPAADGDLAGVRAENGQVVVGDAQLPAQGDGALQACSKEDLVGVVAGVGIRMLKLRDPFGVNDTTVRFAPHQLQKGWQPDPLQVAPWSKRAAHSPRRLRFSIQGMMFAPFRYRANAEGRKKRLAFLRP
jgi:hypothetical protein